MTFLSLLWLSLGWLPEDSPPFRESPGRVGIGATVYIERSISVDRPATEAVSASSSGGDGDATGEGLGVGDGRGVGVDDGDGVGVGDGSGLGVGEGQDLVMLMSFENTSSLPWLPEAVYRRMRIL